MRKEYLYDGKSREMLVSIREALLPITKSFDVSDEGLWTLRQMHHEINRINKRVPYHFDLDEPYFSMLDANINVIGPIVHCGYLPTGGEQRGNMLCIESVLINIKHTLAHS